MKVNILFIVFLCFGGLMFLVALITKIFPAKKPNSFYGYRTDRSMRNRRNWKYAQSLLPAMFFRLGILFSACSLLWYFATPPSEMIGMALFFVLLVAGFAFEIYKSEKKLKRYSKEKID